MENVLERNVTCSHVAVEHPADHQKLFCWTCWPWTCSVLKINVRTEKKAIHWTPLILLHLGPARGQRASGEKGDALTPLILFHLGPAQDQRANGEKGDAPDTTHSNSTSSLHAEAHHLARFTYTYMPTFYRSHYNLSGPLRAPSFIYGVMRAALYIRLKTALMALI